MGPAETGAALVRRLRAEVRADREVLERRQAEIARHAAVTDAPEERLAALALALDRAYTTLESILERVARSLEGGPPVGEDWHAALLANARLEIDGVRPRLLGDASWAAADELRRFRHFLRHAYGSDREPERLGRVARAWIGVTDGVRNDLDRLEGFLESLAQRLH
jgi:hypothetical protein